MDARLDTPLKRFLTFPAILGFFYSKRSLILIIFAVAFAVSTGLSFVRERVFETAATIVVFPPLFRTDLNPEAFTVQTYESFVQSDGVLEEVLRRTPELNGNVVEDLRGDLRVTTMREKSGNDVKFSPMIKLHARATDPKLAKKLADTWAEVSKEKAEQILKVGKEDTLKFVGSQFDDLSAKLKETEQELVRTSSAYRDRFLQTMNDWEQKIAQFKATWNIERMMAEVWALNTQLSTAEAELGSLDTNLKVAQQKVERARERLKLQPEKIVLRRSATDDALWGAVASQGAETALENLKSLSLGNEEINPTYFEIAKEAELAELSVAEFQAKKDTLEKDLKEMLEKADAINKTISEKSKELILLELGRDTAVAKVEIEEAQEVARLTRLVDQYKKTHETIAPMAEAARMTANETTDFMKISSNAIVPAYPTSTSSRKFFIIGATAATTLCAILVLLVLKILSLMDIEAMQAAADVGRQDRSKAAVGAGVEE